MKLLEFHPLKDCRHAGTEALSLSCHEGVNFDIERDDCICLPCYKDYIRNKQDKENRLPRWVKVKQDYYARSGNPKHCIYCCGDVCECERVHHWGPDNWYGENRIISWKQYLSVTGEVDYTVGEHIMQKIWNNFVKFFLWT